VCNLCKKVSSTYTQMRTHLDKFHRIKTQVCLTRLFNDDIVCGVRENNLGTFAPAAALTASGSGAEAAEGAVADASVTDAAAAEAVSAIAATSIPTTRAYQYINGTCLKNVDPNERIASVSMFGTTKIIKFVHPPEPETFNIEALQEEAYACGDFGDTTWDETYERFESQEQVPPSYSLYRNLQGDTVVTSLDGGSRYVEFKYGHINNEQMIDAIVRGTLSGFSFFLRALFENPYNRFLYKRCDTFPFTDVHIQYGCWMVQQDSHIYPRVLESIAVVMRKYMNVLVRNERFIKIFSGTRDYESLDHFLFMLSTVQGSSEFDPDYTHDMLTYFYKYVKEIREIVASYSKTSKMPWVMYPVNEPVAD